MDARGGGGWDVRMHGRVRGHAGTRAAWAPGHAGPRARRPWAACPGPPRASTQAGSRRGAAPLPLAQFRMLPLGMCCFLLRFSLLGNHAGRRRWSRPLGAQCTVASGAACPYFVES